METRDHTSAVSARIRSLEGQVQRRDMFLNHSAK
ncbi:hypothetical protein F441_02706 [Phytophthora nicotianae CJ01A1]|uniref:Uncharacterized protein n=6 Tax=Phytophthora nicotianae TaxID=4792 RepID=W2PIC5_PHYN3|nr:hypothetical protein PPTG_24291 [Phytophthora nicotianae INRA-310]ETI32969.1 hypothetical protein F443_20296 [Phytophthora nicotianae P1569]ETK73304.1 hypothetical protein L915_19741 [Phytophthora nicotianae]ETO61709.1 hypothetical protein F444_20307 [Phytophthora nicotianae P1976]ETP24242.1 hypothetical protein F441_02706 [Phytophthora nicotianae CJ01A1]ETP30959.1 hypothetical protein F442_20119 [Phytophthora nicotianae P10297]